MIKTLIKVINGTGPFAPMLWLPLIGGLLTLLGIIVLPILSVMFGVLSELVY